MFKSKTEKKYFGYSNENNRFGDTELSTPFIWKKKWEKVHPDVKGAELRNIVTQKLKDKQNNLIAEVNEVKRLRNKREREKEALEKLRDQMQKELEQENYDILNNKEAEFHKSQAVERSIIRLKNNREKPIDLLYKSILIMNNSSNQENDIFDNNINIDVETTDPIKIISLLDLPSLQALTLDIQENISLGNYINYWRHILVIVNSYINDLTIKETNQFNTKVRDGILHSFSNKSYEELENLEKSIKNRLENKGDSSMGAIDFEYWNNLLPHIKIFKSKKYINDYYKSAISKKIAMVKMNKITSNKEKEKTENERKVKNEIEKSIKEKREMFCDSPLYISKKDERYKKSRNRAIGSNEYFEKLAISRMNVLNKMLKYKVKNGREKKDGRENKENSKMSNKLYRMELSKPLEEGEILMKSIIEKEINETHYSWEDKFKPRKPLYFNRIKTGYVWNKYNQTHYDIENPPAKVVKGYKFNIFYPDLADVTSTPTFVLETLPDSIDYIIIRFKAGAPYEDIAFKIVNKEWDQHKRRGYKSCFHNGVLQLFFNFKRYAYRR